MKAADKSDALADFSHLTPDHVIEHVEQTLGVRCTNLCRQLNSYINRVYELQTEDGRWVIIKFYRPGRWSRDALMDEIEFLRELNREEIPVVAPLFKDGTGLREDQHGVFFTLFPKIGGRPLVEPAPERWIELGRLLARMHEVGARHPPRDRIQMHPEHVTLDHLDSILASDFPHEYLRKEYGEVVDDLIDLIAPMFDDAELIRIHGDCHAQNLLDRPDEPLRLIDFDDMAVGPPVQDIWMLLPDRTDRARHEFDLILQGYEVFRDLPPESLRLIEPLRAMRFIHYTAWCARQKADGGFNRLSPDWGSASFWKKEVDELRKQIALIKQGGIMIETGYTTVMDPFWAWFSLTSVLHLVTFIWVLQHLARHRRDPVSAMLWIMVTWTIPFIGFFIYLGFGINRVEAKSWKKENADLKFQSERSAREADELPLNYWRSIRASVSQQPDHPVAQEIDRTISSQVTDHPLLGGNRIELLITGDEAFPRMLEAIKNARRHIHVQSFIIGNDAVGRALMAALAEKARAGVKVRVLYDRFGSTLAVLGGVFFRYRGTPNLQMAGWSMARLLKRQFQINLRNHRKVLIVDGEQAFTGGINLQVEHTTRGKHAAIRDYHVSLHGPIVSELQYTFLRDWYYITEEDPDRLLCEDHFPRLEPAGHVPIRMVNGGPATELDEICDTLFACLVSAKQSILAVTPYLVPTTDIVQALRNAALRGVDVRVVVPEENNHFFAGWAGRAYYEELLASGVRVYERKPPFMHAKGLIIDDAVAMIGSANFDVRSLKLNYETNLMVYDPDFINKLKQVMLEEIAMSLELDLNEWRQRPLSQKMKENACSLLTPIL